MKTLNEHVNRMRQLFNAEHGIIKPLVSEQDEMGDEMINKKGYGENLVSSVNVQIKNNDTQNTETISASFKEDMAANHFLSKSSLTDWDKMVLNDYGYSLIGVLDKTKYKLGDEISIDIKVPLSLTRNSEQLSKNIKNETITKSGGKDTFIYMKCVITNTEDSDSFDAIGGYYEVEEKGPGEGNKKLLVELVFE